MSSASKKTKAELLESAKQGFEWHQSSQESCLLEMWPAQEWFKCIDENFPTDYAQLWISSGGRIFSGKMIALKDDPIWSRVSKFGLPYPPFDEYDAMWVRDVDRDEAERLGIISRKQALRPDVRNWVEDKKQIQ